MAPDDFGSSSEEQILQPPLEEELYRDVPFEKLPREIRVEMLKKALSDDPESLEGYLCPGEVEVDYEKWVRYFEKLRESKHFDVDIEDYPKGAEEAFIRPRLNFRSNGEYPKLCDFAIDALNIYNRDTGENYAFKDILSVNVHAVSGLIYYITFKAVAADAAGDAAGDVGEIFQARIWDPVGEEAIVDFCRRKPVKP